MLADHHFHVDAEIIVSPEDFNDSADGGTRGRGPTGDLDVNDEILRIFRLWTGCRFTAEDAMRRGVLSHPFRIRFRGSGKDGARGRVGRDFRAGRDDDGLGHALIEGNDDILPVAATGICVVKRADDGGIAALQNANDAALHTAVGFGGIDVDKDLVALHGAADLIGRDENILDFRCPLTAGTSGSAIGPHEAVAVAVKIEAPGQEIAGRT
jgi:hypothetical protein